MMLKSYNHRSHCHCGQVVFFENNTCLRCGSALAFFPDQGRIVSLIPADIEGRWVLHKDFASDKPSINTWQRCANLHSVIQCNWLVSTDQDKHTTGDVCLACALNVATPDLEQSGNPDYWRLCEIAKRRLIAQLLRLGLEVPTREQEPHTGLGFALLRWKPGEDSPITGHKAGIITIDIAEADPAFREQIRQQMQEPYRSLLGHCRHESGHYYWEKLIRNSSWLNVFRQLFGDERQNYTSALQHHYNVGPPPDWQNHYISSYAASHPWEDWAETWAHFLHMTDTLAAAEQVGIQADALALQTDPFTLDQVSDCPFYDIDGAEAFLVMVNRWVRLSSVLNVLARSMGQPDSYPFVLTTESLKKLYMVVGVVGAADAD
jgi:hypothetical protein